MQPNRVIDDRAHRLAVRRVDGRMVAGRLIVAGHERLLVQAGARMTRWLVEQGFARWAGVTPATVAAQGDMICAFALAGRLGWDGPWRALVSDRLEVLLARARRPDGLFVHALGPDGAMAEEGSQAADQAAMARALTLGGRALGWDEVAAIGADLRLRMARAGMADDARGGVLGQHARDVLDGVARWWRLGDVADARLTLGAVAGMEDALSGPWRDGGDLWCFAQAAGALNAEDRTWLCP